MRHLNRHRYTTMIALAAIAVVAVFSIWGPWNPRLVVRDDPAGAAVAVVTPAAPIVPETAL